MARDLGKSVEISGGLAAEDRVIESPPARFRATPFGSPQRMPGNSETLAQAWLHRVCDLRQKFDEKAKSR
jgi:hypothetical protein